MLFDNKYFVRAFKEYIEALRMVREGRLGNAARQRANLFAIRILLKG